MIYLMNMMHANYLYASGESVELVFLHFAEYCGWAQEGSQHLTKDYLIGMPFIDYEGQYYMQEIKIINSYYALHEQPLKEF